MEPKVSIIMPVLNGERYIGEAIESVIAQTYSKYELLVINDGSTDETEARVAAFRGRLDLQYIKHPVRQGIPQSMNDGVRHASGDFIAFLDHDDTWFPDFLENQVAYLQRHPETAMVHCDFQTIGGNSEILEESVAISRRRKRPSGNVFRELFMDSFIVGNSVLIRKDCFTRLGSFDESLRWGDYHMWLRIARFYRVDYVGRVLTRYRQHPTQSTRNVNVARPDEDSVALMAIKKILASYPEIRGELGESAIRRRMASLYFDLAYRWYETAEYRNARICAGRALEIRPFDWRNIVVYMASLLPLPYARELRQRWRWIRGVNPVQN